MMCNGSLGRRRGLRTRWTGAWRRPLVLGIVVVAALSLRPLVSADENDLDEGIAEARGLYDAEVTPQAIVRLQSLLKSRTGDSPEGAMQVARISVELAAVYEGLAISPMAIQLLKTKALELSSYPTAEKVVREELALLYDRLGFGPQALRERQRIRHIHCP